MSYTSQALHFNKYQNGVNAVTYTLSVVPNSWNNTGGATASPQFTVTKYDGDVASQLSSGYTIKVGNQAWTGTTISNTTTFDLYIDGIDEKVDSETVTAVENGADGTRGTGTLKVTTSPSSYSTSIGGVTPSYYIPLALIRSQAKVDAIVGDILEYSVYHYPIIYIDTTYAYCGARTSIKGSTGDDGDTVSTVYAYCLSNNSALNSKPSGTPGTPWSLTEPSEEDMSEETNPYLYRSEGVKTVSGSSGGVSYTNWQDAVLIKAWNGVGVPYDNYAEYLKITNFGTSGLYYNGGKLYINADHIKVTSDGTGTGSYVVFEASGSSSTISMAGFTVNRYGIYNDKTIGMFANGRGVTSGGSSVGYLRFVAGGNSSYGWDGSYSSAAIENVASFAVTSTGFLYAANAKIAGNITATSGTLSNLVIMDKVYLLSGDSEETDSTSYFISANVNNETWYIYLPSFKVDDDGVQIGGSLGSGIVLNSGGTSSSSTSIGGSSGLNQWSLAVGTSFGVTTAGVMYATGANISGVITASSGNIGGWSVSAEAIYSSYNNKFCGMHIYQNASTKVFFAGGSNNDGDSSTFYVKGDGSLYASSGTLATGCILGPSLKVGDWSAAYTALYSSNANKANSLGALPTSSTGGLLIIASDDGDSCGINCRSAYRQAFMNAGSFGVGGYPSTASSVYESVRISINNPEVSFSDTSNCGRVGGFTSDGWYTTALSYYSGTSGKLEIGLQNNSKQAIEITGQSTAYSVKTIGTWTGSISGSSDYRLKKNIATLKEQYDDFFDLLSPIRFQFYNPSDGRNVYHVGFIAQEVLLAQNWAKLDSDEWGGIVTYKEEDIEYYALTYTEFVALNTWQIQKLKPRMTAAEQEIEKLKLEIQQLRTELQNLQNS